MSATGVEQAAPEPVHDGDETREVRPIPVERWVDVVRGGWEQREEELRDYMRDVDEDLRR